MTAAEKHIRHFNRMNGKEVRRDTLQQFYSKVEHISSLKLLKAKLAKALRLMGSEESVVIKFKPLKYSAPTKLSGADPGLLYGLQNIQKDAHLNSSGLDGLNDTTYKVITDRILELMKSDGLIWRKPWNDRVSGPTHLAHNYGSKHVYRGVNFYLNYLEKYGVPYYFTFKQVTDMGGKVKKGEKGWPVIYFKWLYKDRANDKLVPEEVAIEKGKLKKGYDQIPGLFYYNVWNYEQTEGLKVKTTPVKKRTHKEIISSAERIIQEMPKRPQLTNGPDAWYSPSKDLVQVPKLGQFKVDQHYYSVFFHELVHSTGHSSRVSRDLTGRFGSKRYAFEELIAELGASFLCGESGILYFTMKNSAAYIKNWSSKLREEMKADPKFFLRAAAAAQKAADFMLAIGEYEKLKKKSSKHAERKVSEKAVKQQVAKTPVSKRKSRPPVKRAKHVKDTRENSPAVSKPATALSGFTTADQAPDQPKNLFRLPGVMGDLLGDLQRYKLEIVIAGETHSGKSEIGKQIADAFISLGDDVAWIDWEQGGLASRDTKNSIIRNVRPENHKKLFVSSEVGKNLNAIKALADKFKVIGIDSGTKLNQVTNAWIDQLREEHPDTVWIILMQQNEKGGTRGGSSAEFDSPVVIKTYRPDESDFRKNYAYVYKNRGNRTGLYYNIADKQIISNPERKAA